MMRYEMCLWFADNAIRLAHVIQWPLRWVRRWAYLRVHSGTHGTWRIDGRISTPEEVSQVIGRALSNSDGDGRCVIKIGTEE